MLYATPKKDQDEKHACRMYPYYPSREGKKSQKYENRLLRTNVHEQRRGALTMYTYLEGKKAQNAK